MNGCVWQSPTLVWLGSEEKSSGALFKREGSTTSCSWPTSRLRAQRCVNVGVLRASRVVVRAWWDPVCRHLRLRACVLLITGECRARVGLEQ